MNWLVLHVRRNGSEFTTVTDANPVALTSPLCAIGNRLRAAYEDGHLPGPGCVREQSGRAMALIRKMQECDSRARAWKHRLDEAEAKRRGGG